MLLLYIIFAGCWSIATGMISINRKNTPAEMAFTVFVNFGLAPFTFILAMSRKHTRDEFLDLFKKDK